MDFQHETDFLFRDGAPPCVVLYIEQGHLRVATNLESADALHVLQEAIDAIKTTKAQIVEVKEQ